MIEYEDGYVYFYAKLRVIGIKFVYLNFKRHLTPAGVRDVRGWVQVRGDQQPVHEPLGPTEAGAATQMEADAASP